MTLPEASAWRVCPFLGIPDDPGSHFSFPELAHRCHAGPKVERIELGHQTTYCLGGGYEDCPRFQSATAPIPAWHPAARLARPDRHATQSRAQVSGSPLMRTAAGRALNMLVGVLMVALVAAGVFALGSLTNPRQAALPETGAISPTPSLGAPSLLPSAGITVTPEPPSLAPTGQATADPAPTTTPQRPPTGTPSAEPAPVVHFVQEGESLSIIAAQYGLTWLDLASANDLENPDTLYVGQRLVVPIGPVPTGRTVVHVVEAGETLASIAFLYGVTPAEIARANDLADRNRIHVGQRLTVPAP